MGGPGGGANLILKARLTRVCDIHIRMVASISLYCLLVLSNLQGSLGAPWVELSRPRTA